MDPITLGLGATGLGILGHKLGQKGRDGIMDDVFGIDPPPAPPTPEPIPPEVEEVDLEAQKNLLKKKAKSRKGRQSTILGYDRLGQTGGAGSAADTLKQTLG